MVKWDGLKGLRKWGKTCAALGAMLVVGLSGAGLQAAAQDERVYDFTYQGASLPYVYNSRVVKSGNAESDLEFTFEVTEDFVIDDVSFVLEAFLLNVGYNRIDIISPAGTRVKILENACGAAQQSVVLGEPIYEPDTSRLSVFPQPNDPRFLANLYPANKQIPSLAIDGPGKPLRYEFADDGSRVGSAKSTIPQIPLSDNGVCTDRFASPPTWPGPSEPGVSSGWGKLGAFATLPQDVYSPQLGENFERLRGENAKGTWTLRIRTSTDFSVETRLRHPEFQNLDINAWQLNYRIISSAQLVFSEQATPPELTLEFEPNQVSLNETTELVMTIDNPNSDEGVTDIEFTAPGFRPLSTLGLELASTTPTRNTCGASVEAVAPTSVRLASDRSSPVNPGEDRITVRNATVSPRASCEIAVPLRATIVGALPLMSSSVSSSRGAFGGDQAELIVADERNFQVRHEFSRSELRVGENITHTITFDNTQSTIPAENIRFYIEYPFGIDHVQGARPIVSGLCNWDLWSDGVYQFGTRNYDDNFSGSPPATTVPAGKTCTVTMEGVGVINRADWRTYRTAVGHGPAKTFGFNDGVAFSEVLEAIAVRVGNLDRVALNAAIAGVDLPLGEATELVYTIDNYSDFDPVSDLQFTTNLPVGVSVNDTVVPTTTCGGSVSQDVAANSITLSGGALTPMQSCEVRVSVRGTALGFKTVSSSELSTSRGTFAGADAFIEVKTATSFAMAFDPNPLTVGDAGELVYEISNETDSLTTGLAFSHELPSEVFIMAPTAVRNACGGTLSANDTTGIISLTGGVVSGNTVCEIAIPISSILAGSYFSETSALSTSKLAAASASDTITVIARDATNPALTFSSLFNSDDIRLGQSSTLTYTIQNTAAARAESLAFTDMFQTGLIVDLNATALTNQCGGTFTAVTGQDNVSLVGGGLDGGATCTISFGVTPQAGGDFQTSSSDLTSSLGTTPPASASLMVETPVAPSFSKAFDPDTIEQGGRTTLTYTINNSTALVPANSLGFSDTFADEVLVDLSQAVVDNQCGGTFAAVDGDTEVSLTGGSVAAGATCTITLDITSAVAGSYTETSEALSSTLGDSGTASATLSVNSAGAPIFTKEFDPDVFEQGAGTTLTYTIDNSGALVAASGLNFTDTFPTNLVVDVSVAALDNQCGGTVVATDGSGSVSLNLGTVGAGQTCEISIGVRSDEDGTYNRPSGDLTSSLGTSAGAQDELIVEPADAPTFSKVFTPNQVMQGGGSTLTYTIDNTGALVAASGLGFTDTFPTNLIVDLAQAPLDDQCSGTLTAADGSGTVSFSGGTVPAGASCTLSLGVRSDVTGVYDSTSGPLSSSLGQSDGAADTFSVTDAAAPAFSKLFDPDTIIQGALTSLTYTIDNSASLVAAANLTFTDNLPNDVVLDFTQTPLDNQCGGTLVAASGTNEVSLSGATLAAGGTCTIKVGLRSDVADVYRSSSGGLTSSLGQSGSAQATLTVNGAAAPSFAKLFDPNSITQGGLTTLTYTIDNAGALVSADDLTFTDIFPTGLEVDLSQTPIANTCGGTVTAQTGGSTVVLTRGSVGTGASCTITLGVTSAVAGTLDSDSEELTSSLGDSGTASATLTVTGANAPAFTKLFNPNPIVQGGLTTLTYTIDNSAALVPAEGLDFTDAFPSDLLVDLSQTPIDNQCQGTVTAVTGTGQVSLSNGSVAAGASCTITLGVTSAAEGSIDSVSGLLDTSLGQSPGASATLTVDGADAPLFAKVFTPDQVLQGAVTTLTYSIDNASALVAAEDLAFTHTLPADLFVDLSQNAADNQCGGTLTATDGSAEVSLTGGSVAAGQSCTITVDVSSAVAGDYDSASNELTSTLGSSGTATASLTVDTAQAPAFTKVFAPDQIVQGAKTVLTYTIDNSNSLVPADNLEFTDAFPADLLIDLSEAPIDNQCGGALTASPTDGEVILSQGLVDAGASCTITLGVRSDVAGSYDGESEELTSTLGSSGTASATLTVESAIAPAFTKLFDPDEIEEGATTLLTYTIDNSLSMVAADGLTFAETLPEGLVIERSSKHASSCGGAMTAAAGGSQIALANGTVEAQETCEIALTVRGTVDGLFTAVSGELISNLGNSGVSSADLSVLDVTPPTVVITSEVDSFIDLSAILVTFTFSEEVTGFALGDIVVGSGSAAGFETVSPLVYTALLTPSGRGDMTVDVPEGVANDLSRSANGNLAAEQLILKNGIIELTQRMIRNFLTARMDTIVSNEPDLFERMTQRESAASGGGSGFSVNYTADSTYFSFNSSLSAAKASLAQQPQQLPFESSIMRRTGLFGAGETEHASPKTTNFDVWTKGVYAHTSFEDRRRSETGILYLGADWLLNPDLIVGVLTQFDWTDERDRDSGVDMEGFGWMTGPYAIQRLSDQLILDGRVAAGQSDNKINPIGLYQDTFKTDRMLASTQLTGDFQSGRFVINPFVRAIYMEEIQKLYTDTLGNEIGEQTVSLGRVNFGPKIRMVMQAEDGTMTTSPYIKLEGLYDFRGGQRLDAEGLLIDEDRLRGRFTGGMNLTSVEGWRVAIESFLDGIGQQDVESYGASINLSLTF